MASALCRSKSLTNVYVQKVAVLDIMELKTADDQVRSNQWAYVISVTWSDTRESKVSRIVDTKRVLRANYILALHCTGQIQT